MGDLCPKSNKREQKHRSKGLKGKKKGNNEENTPPQLTF